MELKENMDALPLPKDLFEAFLKINHHKKSIIEIKNIKFTTLKKGENYVSEAFRVEVQYLRCDGHYVTEFYFVKAPPATLFKQKYVNDLGLIHKEIKVYAELLPQMEQLLHSVGDYTETLWPECIGTKCYDLIVMKDLISRGFHKCDKRIGLDLEHSILVLKALGKFHALSVVLNNKMLLDIRNFQSFGFTEENDDLTRLVKNRLEIIAKLMEGWGCEWQNLRKSLIENSVNGTKMMAKACQFNPNGFNVVIHGDLWTSNILFKRCSFTGNLCGVKLLDFQEAHYNSYAIDIQYFLHTSVQGHIRKNNHKKLMSAYYESLISSFKLLQHQPEYLPTINDILEEVENKRIYGVITSLVLLHLMQAKPEQAIDLEEWLNGDEADDMTNSKHFTDKLIEILEPIKHVDLKSFL